jgi:hypothetical protein
VTDTLDDIGLTVPEPDTSLMAFLRAHPEFVAVCKTYGWWAETITKLEADPR